MFQNQLIFDRYFHFLHLKLIILFFYLLSFIDLLFIIKFEVNFSLNYYLKYFKHFIFLHFLESII